MEIQLLLLALCLSIGARLCASSCASVCVDKVSGVNRPHIHTTRASMKITSQYIIPK